MDGKTPVTGFRVFWSAEDQAWVATSDAYPSLSHLAGSPEGALLGMIKLQRSVALDLLVENSQEMGGYT